MTNEQILATQRIALMVLETIKEQGDMGAPGGIIYAALMGQGCSLNQFQSLMRPMVEKGFLTHEDEVYTMTPAGEKFIEKLRRAVGVATA